MMAVHSVGGAHPQDSGFTYNWQENPYVFNNQLYKNMLSKPYDHLDTSTVKTTTALQFVWVTNTRASPNLLALNTDFSLLKDLTALKDSNGFTGNLQCKSSRTTIAVNGNNAIASCNDNPLTAQYVVKYANNLNSLDTDFPRVWNKMTGHGNSLKLPGDSSKSCGSCIPAKGVCTAGFTNSGSCCSGFKCTSGVCK